MTRKSLILIAAGGSFALLAGAFFFQALGWAPCKMCLWQRWPHAAAIAIGALGFVVPMTLVILAGAVSAGTAAAIALYHSGVELKLWEGPSSCSGGAGLSGQSGASLLPGASDAPVLVMCDTLTPFFLGLTMANWNFIFSAGLVLIWLWAARQAD
ncbi:disulfide bond formation protein B [Roseobacteraceae bacterium S113]